LEERRVVLSRVTVLDSVEVRAEFVLPSFEENRRVGLGRFLTRDDLAKMEGRSFEAVMNRFNGVEMERGTGTNSWLMSSRRTASLGSGNFFVPEPADSALGARPACYAHVYLDNVPVFTSRPGEPLFNLNSISPDAIEALEYYAGPSSTPARYTALRATCGVLVIWTRR
jgi:hypothetical protein